MIAMELSGVHVGKLLKISWKALNKDGSVRANARPKEYYALVAGGVYHLNDGQVMLPQAKWFSQKPDKTPDAWKDGYYEKNYTKYGYRIDNNVIRQDAAIAFNAEVEVIDD